MSTKTVCIGCSLSLRVSVSYIVWKYLLVFGLVVSVEEAMTVEELGHDVGLEGHVERRACLLALKQVRVVTHLHTGRHKTVDLVKKGKDPGTTHACSETANSLFGYSYWVSDSETILPEIITTNNRDQSSWLLLLTKNNPNCCALFRFLCWKPKRTTERRPQLVPSWTASPGSWGRRWWCGTAGPSPWRTAADPRWRSCSSEPGRATSVATSAGSRSGSQSVEKASRTSVFKRYNVIFIILFLFSE